MTDERLTNPERIRKTLFVLRNTCLDKYCLAGYSVRVMTQAIPCDAAARFDSPEQEVFLNLWRTYDRLRALEDELFRAFDLTPQQYNVLRLLRAAEPDALPTLTLADRLVSRAPDVTRMLDKLEQAGFVARLRPPENRRQVLVSITESGSRLLEQISAPLRECHKKQLGHLSKSALKQLTTLLHSARKPHDPPESSWL